jgi:hypothetical protein
MSDKTVTTRIDVPHSPSDQHGARSSEFCESPSLTSVSVLASHRTLAAHPGQTGVGRKLHLCEPAYLGVNVEHECNVEKRMQLLRHEIIKKIDQLERDMQCSMDKPTLLATQICLAKTIVKSSTLCIDEQNMRRWVRTGKRRHKVLACVRRTRTARVCNRETLFRKRKGSCRCPRGNCVCCIKGCAKPPIGQHCPCVRARVRDRDAKRTRRAERNAGESLQALAAHKAKTAATMKRLRDAEDERNTSQTIR